MEDFSLEIGPNAGPSGIQQNDERMIKGLPNLSPHRRPLPHLYLGMLNRLL